MTASMDRREWLRQAAFAALVPMTWSHRPLLAPATSARTARNVAPIVLGTHRGDVWATTLSPKGDFLVSSGEMDSSLKIWSLRSDTLTRELNVEAPAARRDFDGNAVNAFAFSPDGAFLGGSWDRDIRLWQTVSGRMVARVPGDDGSATLTIVNGKLQASANAGHAAGVRALTFSSDGRFMATGALESPIKVFQVSNGKYLRAFEGPADGSWALAFCPDFRYFAAGGTENTIRLMEMRSGALAHALPGHESGVRALTFSPDSRFLASGGSDNAVRIWDVASGAAQRVLTGHSARIQSLAYSSDGALLASTSSDHTTRVWNSATGEAVGLLNGGGLSVAFSDNNATLLAAAGDRSEVKLWRARLADLPHP